MRHGFAAVCWLACTLFAQDESRSEVVNTVSELTAALERVSTELAAAQQEVQRLQAERSAPVNGRTDELLRELRAARAELSAQAARLRAAETAASQAIRARDQAMEQVATLRATIATQRVSEGDSGPAPAGGAAADERVSAALALTQQALDAALASADTEAARWAAERREAEAQLNTRIQNLEHQLVESTAAHERLQAEKRALEQSIAARPAPAAAHAEDELQVHRLQAQVEELRGRLAATERQLALAQAQLSERDQAIEAQVARAAELAALNAELTGQRAQFEARLAQGANQLTSPPATSPIVGLAATARSDWPDAPTNAVPSSTARSTPISAPMPERSSEPAGSRLRVSPTRPGSARALALAPAQPAPAEPPPRTERFHVVAPGETLTGISQRHYGSAKRWEDIFEANRSILSSPNLVRPGQRLRIP